MKSFFILFLLLIGFIQVTAQNLLNKPEHVAYDKVHERYLVTNYGNGKIIAINKDSAQQVVIEGISSCLGIHIIDTAIFITHANKIEIYGLTSFQWIQTPTLNASTWLDGMANDDSGFLYAVENAGKLHRVNLTTLEDTIIVSSGLPSYPQDITFDKDENRLLLVGWETGSSITAINLENFSVTDLIQTSSGQYDGIVMDSAKNLYVTSWLSGGRVYKWEYPWTDDPIIFSQGHNGPAGLCYNFDDQLLAVPNFNANSISYLSLNPVSVSESQMPPLFNCTIFPNPVVSVMHIRLEINNSGNYDFLLFDNKMCLMDSFREQCSTSLAITISCPMDNYANGLYYLLLIHNGQYITTKEIIVSK